MASRAGIFARSLQDQDLSQEVENKFHRVGGVTMIGAGSTTTTAASTAPFVPLQCRFFLYSGGVKVKTLFGIVWQYTPDGTSNIATEGWVADTADAPASMHVWLRPKEFDWGTGITEKGNVEIEGLSVAGTPDYIFVAIMAAPSGGSKTNADNPLVFLRWDDKSGTFRTLRLPGKTARGDRVNAWMR